MALVESGFQPVLPVNTEGPWDQLSASENRTEFCGRKRIEDRPLATLHPGSPPTLSFGSWVCMRPEQQIQNIFFSSTEDWEATENIRQSKRGDTETGGQLITFKASYCTEGTHVRFLA